MLFLFSAVGVFRICNFFPFLKIILGMLHDMKSNAGTHVGRILKRLLLSAEPYFFLGKHIGIVQPGDRKEDCSYFASIHWEVRQMQVLQDASGAEERICVKEMGQWEVSKDNET